MSPKASSFSAILAYFRLCKLPEGKYLFKIASYSAMHKWAINSQNTDREDTKELMIS